MLWTEAAVHVPERIMRQSASRQDLKPGERKQVAQKGLIAWFEDISRPKRVARAKEKKP